MRKQNYPINQKLSIVHTNGSTFEISFPFSKKQTHLSLDFYNNPQYSSNFKSTSIINRNLKIQTERNKNLDFNFYSLLKEK
jgi:hypothetical protein